MNLQLLDASLAGLAEAILILFFFAVTIIEAVAMLLMKFNRAGKCFLDSVIVNLASLGVGYLISAFIYNINLGGDNYMGLIISFLATLLVEGLLLQLLNRKYRPGKVWKTALVMNLVTYIGLLVIFFLQGE